MARKSERSRVDTALFTFGLAVKNAGEQLQQKALGEPNAIRHELPFRFSFKACAVTCRVLDGNSEMVIENGSGDPCLVLGDHEIKVAALMALTLLIDK